MPVTPPVHRDGIPAARLRVGECLVDVPLREITRADGTKTRITVKSMAVLLLLVERAGQVVGRDALLDTVWAGTLPTDDVVTQAVTQLRKALGAGRDASPYVETIPKAGYRLLANAEWLPDAVPQEADVPGSRDQEPMARGAVSGIWRTMRAIVSIGALLALGLWWGTRPATAPPAEPGVAAAAPKADLPYTLLTAQPGPEVQPALSPDGALVAYAMPPAGGDGAPAIFLQTTQPTSPRQLTAPPSGHSDHQPRWSPDGRQLMFSRIDDRGGCELLLMPVSGGATRAVGRCDRMSSRYDWLPDGSGIVAGMKSGVEDGRAEPLAILRLSTGQWTSMQYAIDAGDVDLDPRYSPDGEWLVFRRNLSHSDLWRMPASGGPPKRLTHLQGTLSGWDWTPDGGALLIGFIGSESRLYRHDLATARTELLGDFPATGLDVADRGNAMVFEVDGARALMLRYALPPSADTPPQPVFASTGNDYLPSPSPDERWIAFYSDRSRDARLWLGQADAADHLRMVDNLSPIARYPAQWSLDGQRLLVVGERSKAEEGGGQSLYEVDAASGRSRVVAIEGVPYFAQFMPGRRVLTVVDRGAGRLSMRLFDTAATPWRLVAQRDGVGEARYIPAEDRVYFVPTTGIGLWRTDAALRATPEVVDPARPEAYWLRRWGLLQGRPFAIRGRPGCAVNWQWLGREEASGGDVCLDRQHSMLPSLPPVVSTDGKWLYATLVRGEQNSDIGWIALDALPVRRKTTH
jgi:Tol biopolymer transport system component/DNA-binding winged helix-turn-helix (wHTH) protein